MTSIDTEKPRIIVEDFQKEIDRTKRKAQLPQKIIPFRDDEVRKFARDLYLVPIELLRLRKDNGRISSDVYDYEKINGPLMENDATSQKKLESFLAAKDPEKSEELKQSILAAGQRNPAIITCDGFLIDGNRRKMTLHRLNKEYPQRAEFNTMLVVILPGKGEEGGTPTILEIEKLENRLQLQKDGKSEYFGFDRALSLKRKISIGFPLGDQLRDDPQYANLTPEEFKKIEKKYINEYLNPLECAERYLDQCGREGQYHLISTGKADRDGRWQAFLDYSILREKLENPVKRTKLDIDEEEIGVIESAAFNIIRAKDLDKKLHAVMRDLPKLISTEEAKPIIKEIGQIEPTLQEREQINTTGKPLTVEEAEQKWVEKNLQTIRWKIKKATDIYENQQERDTPLQILESVIRRLSDERIDLEGVPLSELSTIREKASEIIKLAKDIERWVYNIKKELENNLPFTKK